MFPPPVLEAFRYLVSGILSVSLNLLIIVLLTEIAGLNYLLSISVCFATVTFVSFCVNRFWTFGKRGEGARRDLARYGLVALIQLPLSLGFCSLGVGLLELPYPLVVALSSIVFVPVTYLVHRTWSFGSSRADPSIPSG
jgi:putative flippase GtrA